MANNLYYNMFDERVEYFNEKSKEKEAEDIEWVIPPNPNFPNSIRRADASDRSRGPAVAVCSTQSVTHCQRALPAKPQFKAQNRARKIPCPVGTYQVFLMNFSRQRGQVMEILPLPLGTRTIWRHLGQSKYRCCRSFSRSKNCRNFRFSW